MWGVSHHKDLIGGVGATVVIKPKCELNQTCKAFGEQFLWETGDCSHLSI